MPFDLSREAVLEPAGSSLMEHEPPSSLRGLVSGYVGYIERSHVPVVRREVPGTRVPFIIPLGPELEVGTAHGGERFRSVEGGFVAGMDDSYAVTRSCGVSAGVQVDFSPLVARAVWGMAMSELTGRIVDLEDVFGADGRDLVEAVQEASAWEERFQLIDAFLIRRLKEASPPPRGIIWAWSELRRSAGGVRAGDMAQALGWSHKRLISEFREHTGLAPKMVARVIRFERLNAKLKASSRVCWAETAADCGYFDQSHLVRDVVQFTGRTPGEHLRALHAATAVTS